MGKEFPQPEGDYLHLNFQLLRDGSVDVLPSFHLKLPGPPPRFDSETSLLCELRAVDGHVLTSIRCHRADLHSDPHGPCVQYHEFVPWSPAAAALVFLRDETEIGVVDLESDPPVFALRPTIDTEAEGNRLIVRWRITGDGPVGLTHMVRYSNDGGDGWQAVADGLTQSEAAIDTDALPGGRQCLFQVVAYSAGLHTVTAQTTPFALDPHPRRAHILSPEHGAEIAERDTVALRGTGYSGDFGTPAIDEIAWTSNVDGFLGYGHELFTNSLSQGAHRVQLGVADGLGGEAFAAVSVIIRPRVSGPR